jgi:hypothetical protein
MGRARVENPKDPTARRRKANQVARRAAEAVAQLRELQSPVVRDSLQSSIELLRDSGLPAPTHKELQALDPAERCTAIMRLLGASGKGLEIARRRAQLIDAEEHRTRLQEFAAMIQGLLGKMKPSIPASATPDERQILEKIIDDITDDFRRGLQTK